MSERVFSGLMIAFGLGGVFYSLAHLMLVNPIAGVVGFLVSMIVSILGLDDSAKNDERNGKK